MSASGATLAAPRILNRKGESVGASGAGGLKTCNARRRSISKTYARGEIRREESYVVESLCEPVERGHGWDLMKSGGKTYSLVTSHEHGNSGNVACGM